jgi:chemotaxis protein CheX
MSYTIDELTDMARHAVKEVFQSMLSMDLVEDAPSPLDPDPGGEIAGSVGFIGATNGVIYVYSGMAFARLITSRMLGLSLEEVDGDEMINDAMGELSNMVGGYVKSRLCDNGSTCTLTIPSIVRGQRLSIEGVAQVTRKIAGFRDGNNRLLAELLIKQP